MSALTPEQIAALSELMGEAMPGPWFRNEGNDVCIQIDGQHHAVCTDQFCYGSPTEKDANARLIALAPSLAATVIEQQAEIERLREALRQIADTEPPSEIWMGTYGLRAVRLSARAALDATP